VKFEPLPIRISSVEKLFFQILGLVFFAVPVVGFRQCVFDVGNAWPFLGQFGVQRDKLLLIIGNFVFSKNRIRRAFC